MVREMAKRDTHKPLVPSSNLGVATVYHRNRGWDNLSPTSRAHSGGDLMNVQTARIITPVSWLAAPEWLTIEEACYLSGHDEATMRYLILDGNVETKCHGDSWLVDKWDLHDYQEILLEVLQWED